MSAYGEIWDASISGALLPQRQLRLELTETPRETQLPETERKELSQTVNEQLVLKVCVA